MSTETETTQPIAATRRGVTFKARTSLGGEHLTPELDPVRRVLSALADSLAATYRQQAAVLDIPLDQIDVRVEAGLDFTQTIPGHLRVDVHLQSNADVAALERLRQTAELHDPLIKLVRHAIPTRLEIALDLRETRSIAA